MNFDVDALNVVNLLRTSAVAPIPQKRKRREWVAENYSRGVLPSYDMMAAAVKAKADVKVQKEADKMPAFCEKIAQELVNLHDKNFNIRQRKRSVCFCERRYTASAPVPSRRSACCKRERSAARIVPS
ncbi:hypothetical protein PF004_g1408 [Phytophthora fragariae]|uniref:Uncharacterized protein n=1 Tax=Phytophthora fragariae TaxID=53985 RepID=A0A6G0PSI1_9STRA|nr:hypothetical protein PF004_g1408 [Phytophthora fragariae]